MVPMFLPLKALGVYLALRLPHSCTRSQDVMSLLLPLADPSSALVLQGVLTPLAHPESSSHLSIPILRYHVRFHISQPSFSLQAGFQILFRSRLLPMTRLSQYWTSKSVQTR